ncbi:Uma2 family endonuclease [Leptothermofonsia sp. ETS-13]|uniref:Uma2 family endonuclease n=1 Tax=Leptothermofonsia sp. ETS-13 TaxID=3035696 RepID=UPI003BA361DE
MNAPVIIPPTLRFDEEEFTRLVAANPDLRMELTAEGELIVMAPTGSEGGSYNAELTTDIVSWNRRTRLGVVFDSSTGFKLPNGAIRSPDTAWIAQSRWDALTPQQRKGYAPICPDFVLELVSESDDVEGVREKMQEYIENGCRLGWMIAPKTRQVEVYRPERTVEVLQFPTSLSGEEVLPGFVLNLETVFSEI